MKAGWEVRRLSEVTTKIGSGATPRGGNDSYKEVGLSLIRSLNVHDLDFRTKDLALIDDLQAEALSNVAVEPRDVLLNITGASIARCTVVPNNVLPARVNQHVSIIRPMPERVDSDFLAYLLVSQDVKGRLLGIGDEGGSTRQALTKAQLQEFPIPLPPLEEQQRIVAVLDEAFEGLTRARAHAEANLQNARELFVGAIAQEFSDLGNAPRKKVGDVARHSLGKMLDKSKNKGVPRGYLRNINVRWFEIDTSDILEMRIEEHELEKYSVKCGDLLICEGGYPGRCSIWDQDEVMFFQKALHRVRFDHNVYGRLLMFFLFMEDQSGSLKENFSGSGIQHFTGQALAKFEMPYPSLDTAEAMVSRIEAIHSASGELEAQYAAKLQSIDALRQTLLQKAFAGELTG